jgi:predicted RNase H-like nuclease (RuvC/YqgF family)
MEPNNSVIISFITVGGTVIVAYIVNVLAKRKRDKPEDRLKTIYEGYEALISQQQEDIRRKTEQLRQTEEIIERLQRELDDTRELVARQQRQLEDSKDTNQELIKQLGLLKKSHEVDQSPRYK